MLVAISLLYSISEGADLSDRSRFYEIEAVTQPSHEHWLQAGIYRLLEGNEERAVELLQRLKDDKYESRYYLGVAYYRLENYEKAAQYFEDFLAAKNDVWQPFYYLSLIRLKQNRFTEALSYLLKMPDNEEKNSLVDHLSNYQLLDEAQTSFADHNYENALQMYSLVDGFFGYREMGMALTYAKLDRHQESLALLDTVIKCSHDEELVRVALLESSRQLIQLKHVGKAKRYLHEYLNIADDVDARFLLGSIFSDETRFDSAWAYYKDLPDTVDPFLFYQGRTEYFLGLWNRAEAKLLKHRDRFPASPHADRTLYILASINFRRQKYQYAIDFWQELIDRFPGSIYAASAVHQIGNSYFKLGNHRRALDAYKLVVEYNPSEDIASEAVLKIYETRYYLHKHPSLIEALRSYIRENPGSKLVPRTKLRIAKLLYDMKHYYGCVSEIDRLRMDYPRSPAAIEAMILRVQASQAVGDSVELFSSLRSLLLNEKAAEYRLYATNELAALWVESAQYDSALYYYNYLLDSETYRESTILRIARIYEGLGQTKEAIAMAEQLIEEYPHSIYLADAYLLHSRALRNLGDYDSAIQILLQVGKKIKDRAEIYLEIGNLYFEIEDFVSARQNFLRACEISKQNRDEAAQALLKAGDASVKIGDRDAGREYYLKANMIAESMLLKDQSMQKLTTLNE